MGNGGDVSEEDEQCLQEETPSSASISQDSLVKAGGLPVGTAVMLVVLSVIGLIASAELVLAEIEKATKGSEPLSCDLNPLIGCGTSLESWQSNLLGIPNAIIGIAFFAGLVGIFLAFVGGARLARWIWWGLLLAAIGSLAGVVFFLQQTVFVIGVFCPYCLVVWTVTIPISLTLLIRGCQGGYIPMSDKISRFLVAQRWGLIVMVYLLVIITIAAGMGSRLAYMF